MRHPACELRVPSITLSKPSMQAQGFTVGWKHEYQINVGVDEYQTYLSV